MRSIKEVLGQKATNLSDQTIANNAGSKTCIGQCTLVATQGATPS